MELASRVDWPSELADPIGLRTPKPVTTGQTMVLDGGLGLHAYEDLVHTSGDYIDIIKIGYGTSVLYAPQVLQAKIKIAHTRGITIIPGGTFLELAVHKNKVDRWFDTIQQLGFTGIEVSDGTIELSRQLRNTLIKKGRELQFKVFTEYGKKHAGTISDLDALVATVNEDINQGALLVTMEGRESGKNAGLFDQNGGCNLEDIQFLMTNVFAPERLMWETPLKSQQIYFLDKIGSNVNLGNISPTDVMSLEALRRGLRSDTFPIDDPPCKSNE